VITAPELAPCRFAFLVLVETSDFAAQLPELLRPISEQCRQAMPIQALADNGGADRGGHTIRIDRDIETESPLDVFNTAGIARNRRNERLDLLCRPFNPCPLCPASTVVKG
jgi:hypothetical protein